MAEKAQRILNRMREKDRKRRALSRLMDPQRRSSTADIINQMDQDPPARVGVGEHEMKVLKEMNELQDFENDNWSRGSVQHILMF